jgi:hypothetical protein
MKYLITTVIKINYFKNSLLNIVHLLFLYICNILKYIEILKYFEICF